MKTSTRTREWNRETNQNYLYDGLSFNVPAELKDSDFRVDTNGRRHHHSHTVWQPLSEHLYGNGRMLSTSAFAANERFGNRYPRHTDKDYYLHDVLGSVIGVTDERGNQKEVYSFDVWGNRYDRQNRGYGNNNGMGWGALPATLFGFNGKRFDPKVGLYDYGFRDYKPEVARWTTVDPIHAGKNWYAYVENDPVNMRDLWGLEVIVEQIIEGIVDIVAGGIVVTGAAAVEYSSGGLASPGVAIAVMGGTSQISYGIAEIATALYGDEIPSSTDLMLEVASYGFAETGFDPPSAAVKESN